MFLFMKQLVQSAIILPLLFLTIMVPTTTFCSPGTITLTGQWRYYDDNNVPRPLVWARLLIFDRESDGKDYLLYNIYGNPADLYTDVNGNYTFGPISNNDGPNEAGLDIVMYVCTMNWAVQIINTNDQICGVSTLPIWNMTDGIHTVNVQIPQGQGAWMIFSYH